MSSAWNPTGDGRIRRIRETAEDAASARPHRLRSGEEAVSPGASRRTKATAQILQLRDEQVVQARVLEAADPDTSWKVGLVRIDPDGVFAFLLFLPLLFIAQWGMMGAAAFAALVPVYIWIRRERLGQVMAPRAFLFLPAALALFSVVWSQAPQETFKAAIEFGMTVAAGLLLSSARNPSAVIKGLAAAFFLYVLVALALGGRAAIGVGAGGYAFSGLTSSKNLLADIASTGMILAFGALLIGAKRRQVQWILLGLGAMVVDLYVVAAARSAGALLGVVMALSAMTGLGLLLMVGKVIRAWLTGALAMILLVVGLNFRVITQALISTGAQMFDKDPTLTGRTYLWYRAADLIQEKPVLGRGYEAFWIQGNLDAEGLWRYFGIDERGGFTFHNTAVELLVTLGWAGLILTAAVAVVGAVFLIRKFVQRPSIALVCWMSVLLYQMARTPIETIGITPFYFSTALAFAALGAAFGRLKLPRMAHPYHQHLDPQVVPIRPVDYTFGGWKAGRSPAHGQLRIRAGGERP